jgi:hypothetical protein
MSRKMKAAEFTYFGSDESKNRVVRFYRQNGYYVCEVEGVPALRVQHPSYERVKAAFEGWWQMSFKDWGASDIDWGDMLPSAEEGA